MNHDDTICVAVCRRVNRAAFAVVGRSGIYDVQRCDAPRGCEQKLCIKAAQLAAAYGATVIVAEPGTLTPAPDNLPVETTTLGQAKRALCGHDEHSNRPLVHAVVQRHPELGRVVDGAKLSGPSACLHRWRTLPVFAVALGLAFLQS